MDPCFVKEEKDGISNNLDVVFKNTEAFARNARFLIHSVLHLTPAKHEALRWIVRDVIHEARGAHQSPATRAFILRIAQLLEKGWDTAIIESKQAA